MLVTLALLLAIGYIGVVLSDYSRVYVHPDAHQVLLPQTLRSGLAFGVHDLTNIFQLRAPGEFRPRWATYLIQAIDQKLRLYLYPWMPLHPTFAPITWLIQLAIAPYLLYRLLAAMTEDRLAALAGVAVYVSAIGFLCGFTMSSLPGKALSNACFIIAFFFAFKAVQRLGPRQTLVEAPGASKYLLLVTLLIGLFVDEMPIAGLFLIPLTFWPHFVPLSLRPGRIGAALANGAFFALPLVVFLLLVVVVMPPFIQTWFGFEFDYLSETLLINGTQRTGTSLVNGLFASLTPWTVLENVTNLFGLSLLPRQVSELTPSPFGQYPGGQVTNLPKIVVLLAFFGLAAFVAVRTRAPFARYARGYLVALALFFVFLTALSIRHIPTVTGYYYGAGFAALFAILIGLLVAGLSRLAPLARPLAALAVLGIVAVQIDNFEPINAGWIYHHNELWTRRLLSDMERARQWDLPVTPSQSLTATEVNGIWAAWKQGRMNGYLREHPLTPAALYEVLELRELNRLTGRADDD